MQQAPQIQRDYSSSFSDPEPAVGEQPLSSGVLRQLGRRLRASFEVADYPAPQKFDALIELISERLDPRL